MVHMTHGQHIHKKKYNNNAAVKPEFSVNNILKKGKSIKKVF